MNNVNTSVGNTSVGQEEYALYGKSTTTENIRGNAFQISVNSFFQTKNFTRYKTSSAVNMLVWLQAPAWLKSLFKLKLKMKWTKIKLMELPDLLLDSIHQTSFKIARVKSKTCLNIFSAHLHPCFSGFPVISYKWYHL